MTAVKQQNVKRIVLFALAAICALLVWRNLIQPARQNESGAIAAASADGTAADSPGAQARSILRDPAPGEGGRRETVMDAQELAALDPTLRLDLLEQTAKVKYQGGARNIFQFYTPPPKPVANPVVSAPRLQPQQPPGPPPSPPMPLKFYGISSRPGNQERKAFLTDGDDIIIAREGDVVGKHYKIVRIGVGSLEWEDTVTHQKGQAPLIEE